MKLINATPFAASWTQGMQPDGRELVVAVVKATYSIPAPGAAPAVAAEQAPLVDADVFAGEPGFSATVYECDFAPRKPKCDVLFNGSAYAPGGVPTERVTVALAVGPVTKSFDVVGHRAWVKGMMGVSATRPARFTKMPFSYGTAFGGVNRSKEPWQFYPANHAGVGFHPNAADCHQKLLPNTEETGAEVTSPSGHYRPMALGAIGRATPSRVKLAGSYDKKWLDDVCPFLPADFKEEYYQAAPVEQQMPHPHGGEEVTLLNLTPAARTSFRLPALDVPILFFRRNAPAHEARAVVDTIIFEPDLGRFTLTARASMPLKRNLFEVADILAGRKSRGWHHAREVGKRHAASLAEVLPPVPRGGSR